ncbi:MAG: helix-turn-helix domain-containing protein, partial [Candidatus Magnetomorum sp.]|nr:helix-turn-helix domain-containing protein [Candidatus Magnetomorum sp.]
MITRKPTHPGEFIKEDIIKELGLSQKQLAKALGVSRKTI